MAGAALSRASSAWAAARSPQVGGDDQVLEHVGRELVTVHRGMRGVGGIKGEHVRVLSANLDLLAAHLVQSGHDGLVRARLRDGLERLGRDAFARDLSARYQQTVLEMANRCGFTERVPEDVDTTTVALDRVAEEHVAAIMRRAVPRLASLADRFDRRGVSTRPVVLVADQKPGDDIGGSFYVAPPLSCRDLRAMIYAVSIASAILGILSLGAESGIYAILTVLLTMIYDSECAQADAEAI